MKNKKLSHQKSPKLSGTEREGLLVTTYGAHAEIEDETGNLVRCHVRKNADPVITGDQVLWLPESDSTGIIVGHLPRKSLLFRPENEHKKKLIAANIDAIIIVSAPPPILSDYMIDRYLVAANALGIKPLILLNKIDLLDETHKQEVMQQLAIYKEMDYTVLFASTFTQDGLADLSQFLHGKTCVLVGASGVGKSSIIAALTPTPVKVGEVSATGLGKHTTTTTRLYHLPHEGNLIDSPGVREFGLWHVKKEDVQSGFLDLKKFLNECRFRDCQHQKEPGCAVQEAVSKKQISEKRLQNYRKILADLSTKRY